MGWKGGTPARTRTGAHGLGNREPSCCSMFSGMELERPVRRPGLVSYLSCYPVPARGNPCVDKSVDKQEIVRSPEQFTQGLYDVFLSHFALTLYFFCRRQPISGWTPTATTMFRRLPRLRMWPFMALWGNLPQVGEQVARQCHGVMSDSEPIAYGIASKDCCRPLVGRVSNIVGLDPHVFQFSQLVGQSLRYSSTNALVH